VGRGLPMFKSQHSAAARLSTAVLVAGAFFGIAVPSQATDVPSVTNTAMTTALESPTAFPCIQDGEFGLPTDCAPPGKQVDLTSGKQVDLTPGGPVDLTPGGPVDLTPGGPVDLTPGGPVDLTPGGPVDLTPGGPVDLTPGGPVDLTPGAPADSGCGCAHKARSGHHVHPRRHWQERRYGTVSVLFEVLGSGVGDTVVVDDGPLRTFSGVPLPFRKQSRVPADIDLLQVHVSSAHADNTGCRISVEGKVVVEHLDSGDCSVNLHSQN
jgi:hypothetical protein